MYYIFYDLAKRSNHISYLARFDFCTYKRIHFHQNPENHFLMKTPRNARFLRKTPNFEHSRLTQFMTFSQKTS